MTAALSTVQQVATGEGAARGAATSAATIVIATVARPVGDTGVQTHTRTLCDAFVAAGHRGEVVTPFDASRLWLPVFAVRLPLRRINRTWSTLWYRKWHSLALRNALRSRLSRAAADVVIAQCPVAAQVALDLRDELGARFKVLLVCHFNHSEAQEYRDKGELNSPAACAAILGFEKRVLEAVDQVVYVSAWSRRIVEEERGIHPRAGRVIHNGIAEVADMPPISRAQLGLAEGDLVFINVGTLEARKNQVGLLDLFARIARECDRARLVLVGDGPDRQRIEQKVRGLDLTQKVKLLGLRKDVPAILPAANVYLHYAALENCPVVLLEAARAGLPTGAIPAGGIPELRDALGSIVDLDPADTGASLQALRPWLSDESLRARAAQTAKETFRRHFTRDTMIRAYLEALGVAQ